MRKPMWVFVGVASLALVASGAVRIQDAPPQVAAIDSGEMMPNGCASCHLPAVLGPDGQMMDVRLSVLLPQVVPDHPDISGMVANAEIPGLCKTCHNGTVAQGLGNIVHLRHFGESAQGGENHFVLMFGGQCLMCHSLDLSTGQMAVKSGTEAGG